MVEQSRRPLMVAIPDHTGALRVVYLFGRDERQIGLDGSSVSWLADIHDSDIRLEFNRGGALAFAKVLGPTKSPLEHSPRETLRRVLRSASEMGFQVRLGFEPEFFVIRRGRAGEVRPADRLGYFSLPPRDVEGALLEIARAAEGLGLKVVKFHHEVAPGQYEIVPAGGDPLEVCDSVVALRALVRREFEAAGMGATFMPKPFSGVNGSGMHLHLSLLRGGRSAFAEGGGPSRVALSFLAGLLRRAREITAVAAPTVNSYKRLVPGHEAPVYLAWGRSNRSALIRVPRYGGSFERVEFRVPDSSSSPHLVAALAIAAGLEGIEEGLTPPEEAKVNVYEAGGLETLPADPGGAARELRSSGFARRVLTDRVVDAIAGRLEADYREYLQEVGDWESTRLAVSEWELSKYLDVGT